MERYAVIITLGALFVGLTYAQSANLGVGILYRKSATADVLLTNSRSYSFYNFLIVSKHPGYPKKRSLIKFDTSIPSTCNATFAKMYLNFWYAHKASFQNVQQVPYLSRRLQVHQINKDWSETQATRDNRLSGIRWSAPYLAIDGTDARTHVQDCVTLYTGQPGGYMEFDVTVAVKNWLAGDPNYGLLIWDVTENIAGRDIRFYSREHSDTSKRPFLLVQCAPTCSSSSCPQYPPPVCPMPTPSSMDSDTQQLSSACPAVSASQVVTQLQCCPVTQQHFHPTVTTTVTRRLSCPTPPARPFGPR